MRFAQIRDFCWRGEGGVEEVTAVNRQLLILIILHFIMRQDEEAFILATVQNCTLRPRRGRLLAEDSEDSDQSLSLLVTVLHSVCSRVTLATSSHRSQRE